MFARTSVQQISLIDHCHQLVNDKLKAACEYYRLPKTGNKADLVTRLGEYLDKIAAKNKKELEDAD